MQADYNESKKKVEESLKEESTKETILIVPRNELLQYSDYENLTTKPIDSLLQVEAIGWIHHYGKERLVVKIGGKFFKAGVDLENKAADIMRFCYIRLKKFRVNVNTRQKYAICDIILDSEWHKMLKYKQARMLSSPDGSLNVVDVKTVIEKGKKRKVLLSKDGTVYRLKKSKLEESITGPGFY